MKRFSLWKCVVVSTISLLAFLFLRLVINDPNKYKWCENHGWGEGIGNCFSLGIEHFLIDAVSFFLLCLAIIFAVSAIISFFKGIEHKRHTSKQ